MLNLMQVLRIIALLTLILCAFMLLPVLVALFYKEYQTLSAFLIPLAGTAVLSGLFLMLSSAFKIEELSVKDGFLFVSLSWITASLVGCLPFVISGAIPSFTDAFFEAMSGFSTTGASILTDIESLPYSLLFWRSLTHWLGGMGIVVLTVALLPILGIGGVHLLKAEAPGPMLDKTMPRITQTAKTLWMLYLSLTVLETLLLMFGGMSLFEALTHTFGTLATGGFSPKNASVGYYSSAYIQIVVTVFMILAGINFGLYFRAVTGRFDQVLRSSELKVYLSIFVIASAVVAISLYGTVYTGAGESLRYAAFQSASILTTTGYATADFAAWPALAKGALFFLMFIGGCSGSTGGGIKVIRVFSLIKLAMNEMKHMIHPRGIFRIRIDGEILAKKYFYPVIGFFVLYIFILLLITLAVAAADNDLLTSFSTALVTLGNIGPGFGKIGPTLNYQFFPDTIKWILSFAMMIGRLELYTVLVLFTREFWQQ
ncbi:MAG: potassium transporter TrkG [candidate division KSB1 bacterium]|nr:potassium transporter TrkG [candidate division KSB1 bacterium]